ncbi:DUF7527 domain-containing protein [Halomarina pelagica]|uniref:DUF7527 domain-containing protein n=1 Tax=Halomarina pelagica TaxID=2961599 RepID=UPI0020C5325F|nr:hypothetical protein [Halomarina sp. BND7]
MDARTVERIREWQSHPFSGDDLPALADTSFTGALETDDAWLFVLNGRAIGVYGGTVGDVADGEGTAYAAPDPAFPLLFTMLEREGEERGRYYTAKTPLEEVDRTLRDGGFTGYVELAENVLSGDYYVVYYGGDAMQAAFVGESGRPIAGQEAFDRAADEVGIYSVVSTDVPVLDLPGTAAPSEDDPSHETDGPDATVAVDTTGAPDASGPIEEDDAPTEAVASAEGESASAADSPPAGRADGEASLAEGRSLDATALSPDAAASGAGGDDRASHDEGRGDDTGERDDLRSDDFRADDFRADDFRADDRRADDLRATLRARETEVQRLQRRVRSLADERDELRAANESLRDERDALDERRERLEASVRELEARIDDLESRAGDAGDGIERDVEVSPGEALAGTNLFVRYRSRGATTLDDVLDGHDDCEGLRRNLDLEEHTRFDAEAARVDGRPFEAFLGDTLEREFVSWLVLDLAFEVVDTGYADALSSLYEALPEIDRAELHGTVDAGEASFTFDVVCRDRLGNPLVVANLHDSREPVEGTGMEALLSGAERVAAAYDTLAGAFVVTASFFDPKALELASEATASGGLFGGGRRASFVRLSRKRGFHLCLVEARDRRFHLTVPELRG